MELSLFNFSLMSNLRRSRFLSKAGVYFSAAGAKPDSPDVAYTTCAVWLPLTVQQPKSAMNSLRRLSQDVKAAVWLRDSIPDTQSFPWQLFLPAVARGGLIRVFKVNHLSFLFPASYGVVDTQRFGKPQGVRGFCIEKGIKNDLRRLSCLVFLYVIKRLKISGTHF